MSSEDTRSPPRKQAVRRTGPFQSTGRLRDLLVIGRCLLHAFVDRVGTGDVGPTLTVAGESPADPDQELPRLEQRQKRPYLSIFDEILIERTCYGHDRV